MNDQKLHSVFITYDFREEIEDEAVKLLEENNVTLITIGQKAYFNY